MTLITETATLDGVTPFTLAGVAYSWTYLPEVAIYAGDLPHDYRMDLVLAGGDWTLQHLRVDAGGSLTTSVTDSNDGVRRTVNFLHFGDTTTTATVTLYNTRVRFIEGGMGCDTTLTLGAQRSRSIELFDGNDTVTQGSGAIANLRMGTGTNIFNGGSGHIGFLEFGNGTNTFNGSTGTFGSIRSEGDTTLTIRADGESITLGSGHNHIDLLAGSVWSVTGHSDSTSTTDLFVAEGAWLRSIGLDSGVNTITVDGYALQVIAGNETTTTTVGAHGYVGTLIGFDGADTLVVNGGYLGAAELGGGDNVVRVKSGGVTSLDMYGGNDSITFGDAEFDMIRMGSGNNIATLGSMWGGAVTAWGGNDSVTTGSGGVGYILLSAGNNTVVTGSGYVGSIQFGTGDDTVIGGGSIGAITTEGGSDRIDLSAGHADYVDAGWSNDFVTLGPQGARMVDLGGDDDLAILATLDDGASLTLRGNDGTDTLSLSRFTQRAVLRLDTADWQDFGTPGIGFISVSGVENLSGSAFSDRLTGSAENNLLRGGSGADTLRGLFGDDTLVGGKGRDVLIGADGADTFVFAAGDGFDRITDFTPGEDHIRFRGISGYSDLTFAQKPSGILLEIGPTQNILLEGLSLAAAQDPGNFQFL